MTFDEMLAAESADTVRLAEAVSLAVLIEPGLLRRARLELEHDLDPGVEADVWFSGFVASRDADGIVFHRDAAEGLRQRLAVSVDRRTRAWALLQQVHSRTSPALQLEEELAWLLTDQADQALPTIKERLRSAIATLVGGERVGLAHWAVQAIHRLPEAVLDLEETRILYTAARLRLGAPTGEDAVPDWMSWVLPTKRLDQVAIRLRMFSGILELQPGPVSPSGPSDDVIHVPAVEPLALDVDSGDGPLPVAIPSGRSTFVRIGTGVVRLRASDGAVYELTPSHDAERQREREIITFHSLFAEREGHVVLRDPLDRLRSASFKSGAGLLITGPPGSGKTGLLVAFVRSFTRLHAVHFFSDRSHRWRDADLAWTSLAAQVEQQLPWSPPVPARPIERLRRALHRLPAAEVPFLMVIDGLDELAPAGRAADDLGELFDGGPPPHACVVCACERGSPIAGQLLALFEGSSSLAGLTLDDRQWRHARVEAAKETGLDPLFAEILDGNFLAAQLTREAPFERNERTRAALSGALRPGDEANAAPVDPVSSVASVVWDLLPEEARTVLGIIAAAREPLTRFHIDEAVGDMGFESSVSFDAIKPWLATGQTPDFADTYVMRHAALRTFVTQRGRQRADPRASHTALLNTVARWTPKDLGEFQKEYSLRYGLLHAAGADDAGHLLALLTNLDFLAVRCRLEPVDRLVAELRDIGNATEQSLPVSVIANVISEFLPALRQDPESIRFVVDAALRQEGGTRPIAGRAPSLRLRHPIAALQYAFREHRGAVHGCARLEDDRLVSWSADGTLKTWRREGLLLQSTLSGHLDEVTACATIAADPGFTLSPPLLVSGSRDGTVRVWPGDRSTLVTTHDAPVRGVIGTHQGVLSWDAAGVIRVCEPNGIETQSVHEHRGAITAGFSDGTDFWSGSTDHTVRVWTGLIGAGFEDVTPDAPGNAIGDLATSPVVMTVRRVLREQLLAGATEIMFDAGRYRDRAVSARLKIIANLDIAERRVPQQGWVRVRVGDRTHMLRVDTIPQSDRESVRLTVDTQRASSTVLEGHTGAITALVSGGFPGPVFSCSEDGTILGWDIRRHTVIGRFRGHESAVLGCETTRTSFLVSWSRDRTLRIWDMAGDHETRTLVGHGGAVLGARVLPGERILSWSSDATLRLWDMRLGTPLAVLEGHTGPVNHVVVLENGSVVSCSDDRTLLRWELPAWER